MKKKEPGPAAGVAGLRERAERKAETVASETGETLTPGQVRQTLHELRVHQIELEMQNDELRRAQAELEASHTRYFDLYDLAPVGYCTICDKNLIQEANLMIADLFGEKRSALVKQPFSRFILPEDQDVYYTFYRQLLKESTPQVCELRLMKKDTTPFWARLTVSPDRNADRDAPVFRVVINDITERRQLEDTRTFLLKCGYPGSNENFFESLARYLAKSLNMDYVCIDRLSGDTLSAQTVAVYNNGNFETNVAYTLKDTPCGDVVGKAICCFPRNVRQLFPKDAALRKLEAESYIGTTLWSYDGKPIGLIAIIGRNPLTDTSTAESLLTLVAFRTAGELERKLVAESLKKASDGLEIQVRERTADLRETIGTLDQERRRFNDVLEMLPAFVVLLTPDHQVKFANRFFTERFGQSDGKRCFEYLFGRTGPCEICEAFKPFTTHAPHHGEWIGPDNRNYDVHDFPFTDTDGTPLVMKMGIDITDRKLAEAALIEVSGMKMVGQLTSGVAHEVRNPLNGILAIVGALSKELSDNDRFQPYMQHMRNQVTRLAVLMEDLLVLGRPLREEQLQEISMVTLVEKTIATYLQTLPSPKPPVRFIKPETPENWVIKADVTAMMQVIINLLENALHHSPEKTEIVCSIDVRPIDKVVLSVKDRGIGIPQEILKKIFDPFFTTRKGGTGLGLSIVRRIVDNHQGAIIAFNNTDGPGATFEVVFPLHGKRQPESGK